MQIGTGGEGFESAATTVRRLDVGLKDRCLGGQTGRDDLAAPRRRGCKDVPMTDTYHRLRDRFVRDVKTGGWSHVQGFAQSGQRQGEAALASASRASVRLRYSVIRSTVAIVQPGRSFFSTESPTRLRR